MGDSTSMIYVPQRIMRRSLPLTILIFCFFLLSAHIFRLDSRLPIAIRRPFGVGNLEKQPPKPLRRPKQVKPKLPQRPFVQPGACLPQIDFIRRPELKLSDNILYSRRCVQPIQGDFDRDDILNIPGPLVSNQFNVNLNSCVHDDLPPCEPLELHVPQAHPKKQYPNLIFGVASSYDRLNESLPSVAHWLAGTGAQYIAVVVDAENPKKDYNLKLLKDMYAEMGVLATFMPPRLKVNLVEKEKSPEDLERERLEEKQRAKQPPLPPLRDDEEEIEPPPIVPVEHHHFMLIRDLMDHKTPKTQWLAILDDDTFFPSLYNLDSTLSTYDPRLSHYLGAISDDFNNFRIWGFMAFGGAGVFVSLPLAGVLEPRLEQCIKEASIQTGDGILRDCIYTHTRTKLTIVPGLNQQDVLGDVSGYFESGPKPLSLHHWKSWYSENIPAQAAVTSICGDCYLQRWRVGDDTLFANGYSITTYPHGLDSIRLDRVEGTWEHPGHEYDNDYGPMREKLPRSKKKSWKLLDVEYLKNGGLRQIYVYKGRHERGEKDEVIELLWGDDN